MNFYFPADRKLEISQILKSVLVRRLGCPITRSNFDPSGISLDSLEPSKPLQTMWDQQNYQRQPGTIKDHIKQPRNNLEQYQTITDPLWLTGTIFNHLRPSPTNSDHLRSSHFWPSNMYHLCPAGTLSEISDHLRPSLIMFCSPSATTIVVRIQVHLHLGKSYLFNAIPVMTFCGLKFMW